jgi:hypothetical protein
MRGWLVLLTLACTSACTTSGYSLEPDASSTDAAVGGGGGKRSDPNDDRDHDGVCDGTELTLGSDPERADTDRDGIPDYTEVNANFPLTDPSIPGPDQVLYLSADSYTTIDFVVRMTVNGSGLGYTGEFRPFEAFDARGITARDFYLGAEAIGGEPTDNVRGMQPEAERFESVLGKTRVSFQLHFAVGMVKVADCTIGYPFEYRLKDDNGRFTASRDYLLIVSPDSRAQGELKYCSPTSCT